MNQESFKVLESAIYVLRFGNKQNKEFHIKNILKMLMFHFLSKNGSII